MFDLHDPTNRDRVAMMRGRARHRDEHYPLTGVGPNVVQRGLPELPADRPPWSRRRPHLHNVPLQIAAERGLPALGVWIWFVVSAAARPAGGVSGPTGSRYLAAAGLGALAAMLAAGFFEYNFGDSEFLMPFLVLLTLPFAAGPNRPPMMSSTIDRLRRCDRQFHLAPRS